MLPKFQLVKRTRPTLYECSVCTEAIKMQGMIVPIWSCYHGCKSIFHLECVQNWGIATVGHSLQFSCPNCRCSSYDLNIDVNGSLHCFCGKTVISKNKKIPTSSLTCGLPCQAIRTSCNHPCPIQCHSGPCPPCSFLGPSEPCATGLPHHLAQRQRRCGSTPEEWFCNDQCPRTYSNCFLGSHKCPILKCHSKCEDCPELISFSCECSLFTLKNMVQCKKLFNILSSNSGRLSCQERCKLILPDKNQCILICHPPSIPCTTDPDRDISLCYYTENHSHDRSCQCGKLSSVSRTCVNIVETEIGYVRYMNSQDITCIIPCGKSFSSCSRHLCNMKCCTSANHSLCNQICNRRLSCGKSSHKCLELCHPERKSCRPCPRPSFPDGWVCPCGGTRVEGPLGCTWTPPQCKKSCNRSRPNCSHYIPHPCHVGDCPPCTVPVYPKCGCGLTVTYSIPCMFTGKPSNCGLRCNKPYDNCIHSCSVRCHSGNNQACPPCSNSCHLQRTTCGHPCSLICGSHYSENCVCDTKIIKSCPCGRNKQELLCSSFTSISIECTENCLHSQRCEALAEALNLNTLNTSSCNFSISSALSSWPILIDVISWASTHLDYVLLLERLFSSHILSTSRKRWIDLPPTGPIKRAMTIRIAGIYKLQTIELDTLLKGSIRFGFPDEFQAAGPCIPTILLSKIATTFTLYDVRVYLSEQADPSPIEAGSINSLDQTVINGTHENLILPTSTCINGEIEVDSNSNNDDLSNEEHSDGWTVINYHQHKKCPFG